MRRVDPSKPVRVHEGMDGEPEPEPHVVRAARRAVRRLRARRRGGKERRPRVARADHEVRLRRRRSRRRGPAVRLGGRRTAGHRAPAGGSLHDPGLLPRHAALVGSALLPLQQPAGDGVPARHSAEPARELLAERRGRAVGPLRARPAARGNREPVRVQDRAAALRGAAQGDAGSRGPAGVRTSTRSRTSRPPSGTAYTRTRHVRRRISRTGTGARTRRSPRSCRC